MCNSLDLAGVRVTVFGRWLVWTPSGSPNESAEPDSMKLNMVSFQKDLQAAPELDAERDFEDTLCGKRNVRHMTREKHKRRPAQRRGRGRE